MIISPHLSKIAGSSFRTALERHFGPAMRTDYVGPGPAVAAYPRNKAVLEAALRIAEQGLEEGIECVHGHFLPAKYLLLGSRQPLRFITWMRDPVERLLSHYHYWRRSYGPHTSAPLHRRVIEEDWSLERFCLGTELQNLYHQYLWGFPLDKFDFTGITEFYAEDLSYFSKHCLGAELDLLQENVGDKAGHRYPIDPEFRQRIAAHHAQDVRLYQQALLMRQTRLEAAPPPKSQP